MTSTSFIISNGFHFEFLTNRFEPIVGSNVGYWRSWKEEEIEEETKFSFKSLTQLWSGHILCRTIYRDK